MAASDYAVRDEKCLGRPPLAAARPQFGLYVKIQIIYWIIARLPDYDNLVYVVDY